MGHPCNDPNLSPEEFLQRVMVDDTFSMALRVKAAKALTLIHTKAPVPPITIHIKDPYSHEYLTRFPWLKEFAAKDSEHINANSQSFSRDRSFNHQPSSETPHPSNIETNSYPLSFEEIQQVKSAVQRLLPHADLSQLPDHLTLCECGHWMPFPCKCARMH